MTTNIERTADILTGWADSEGGLTAIDNDYGGDMTGAAEALADAGRLMPDLPTPDSKGRWATELFGGGVFTVREPGVVDLVRKDGVISNRAGVLRREALRMLAAANHAERERA